MVKCYGCGSEMRFNPIGQNLICDSCGNEMPVENSEAEIKSVNGVNVFDSTLYKCPSCGGEILCDSDTAVTFCSFCGSSVALEGRVVQMMAPSKVLPFKLTKERAKEIYLQKLKKSLFAPAYLKKAETVDQIRGIYMPYWLYDYSINGVIEPDGKRSYRRGDYVYTERYKLPTALNGEYFGVSYDSSSSFDDELSRSIAPFKIKESKQFSVGYMCGFYADTADVQGEVYNNEAREIVGSDIMSRLIAHPSFRGYGVNRNDKSATSALVEKKREMAYFPIWFLSHRTGDKVTYAVINGQTGKITADIPIDYKKFFIFAFILTLPLFLIMNVMDVVILPHTLGIWAGIFALICLFITNGSLNKIYARDMNINDKGLKSVSRQTGAPIKSKKPSMNKKIKVLFKPLTAVIINVLLLMMKELQILFYYYDSVYYGAVFISLIFVFFSFVDVIRHYNKLSMRLPKQFEKRGGDE